MKRLWPILLVLLWTGTLRAAGDQAYLGVFAETRVQQMAGMPKMPALPPGMDLSNLPGGAAMMGMGRPMRSLEVRLWSPGIAPAEASAFLEVPEGLGQGKRLNLDLYRPKPGQAEPEAAGPVAPDFTIKIYWGSSATVRPGQPKVIRMADLAGEAKAAVQRQGPQGARGTYFYKPDWTTGYWPTGRQPGQIGEQASLVGHYALTTTFAGSVPIDDPQNVDFLAPIELTSPDLSKQVALDGAIMLAWKLVPGLLGQHAMVMGMEGKSTLVLWTSAETASAPAMGDWGYLEMAKVRELVSQGVLMKPDRTNAIVPAGIFKNADVANLMMIGYGPGTALDTGQPLPRIQTKTTLSVMLGGKGMSGMEGIGAGE
jgi:hypothetical protein